MRCWKFSQKTKLKQKFFANSEKEVGNFFQDWDHSVNLGNKSLILSKKWYNSICIKAFKFLWHYISHRAFILSNA